MIRNERDYSMCRARRMLYQTFYITRNRWLAFSFALYLSFIILHHHVFECVRTQNKTEPQAHIDADVIGYVLAREKNMKRKKKSLHLSFSCIAVRCANASRSE